MISSSSWLLVLASLPCLLWTQGPDTAPALKQAGITQICVAPSTPSMPSGGAGAAGAAGAAAAADQLNSWKSLGFTVTPLTAEALAAREALQVPGIAPRAGVASPTRSPWVNANGWRVLRNPTGKFSYDVPAGRASLAAAEAFAYGADAVLKIDPKDVEPLGAMLKFLETIPSGPAADLPPIADITVVDDGGPLTGEVMNLLSRRNLLFEVVKGPGKGAAASKAGSSATGGAAATRAGTPTAAPAKGAASKPTTASTTEGAAASAAGASTRTASTPAAATGGGARLTIKLGTKEYPEAEAADPSAFALKVRRQLGDDQRTLRIYGSEVVVGRLTGNASRVRLHVLNYGGRENEGLRIRVRGAYREEAAYAAGTGKVPLIDVAQVEGATEFSLPRIGPYAVVDLVAAR